MALISHGLNNIFAVEVDYPMSGHQSWLKDNKPLGLCYLGYRVTNITSSAVQTPYTSESKYSWVEHKIYRYIVHVTHLRRVYWPRLFSLYGLNMTQWIPRDGMGTPEYWPCKQFTIWGLVIRKTASTTYQQLELTISWSSAVPARAADAACPCMLPSQNKSCPVSLSSW